MVANALSWLWNRKAALVALVAVAFDAALHYGLPGSVAIREGWPYFVTKYLAVEVAVAVVFHLRAVPAAWKPFAAGVAGSSLFGAIYYYVPAISSEPGYLTLPYRLLWGVFHALVIWLAASILSRRPTQAAVAAALLAVSVAVGVLFLPALW